MRAAVLGHPISHSLSPVLHNAAYAALGLTGWHYEAIDCDEARAAGAARRAAGAGPWAGFSCTMPLKRVALELADEADPLRGRGRRGQHAAAARRRRLAGRDDRRRRHRSPRSARPVRTLVRRDDPGRRRHRAGGARPRSPRPARRECTVLVRDLGRADELRRRAERLGVRVAGRPARRRCRRRWTPTWSSRRCRPMRPMPWPSARWRAIRRARRGLRPVADRARARPRPAAARRSISGALMLLHQAAAQVELMTGRQRAARGDAGRAARGRARLRRLARLTAPTRSSESVGCGAARAGSRSTSTPACCCRRRSSRAAPARSPPGSRPRRSRPGCRTRPRESRSPAARRRARR